MNPSVDIIIPHFNGSAILLGCLASLKRTDYAAMKIFIVDNGSTDTSIQEARTLYPEIEILSSPENLGYAGGCNFGFEKTNSPYVVFLNNDTEHSQDWLKHLVEKAQSDFKIGALQPKILSIQSIKQGKRVFDYAGAAGGLLDRLGYPYAYGRMFSHVESDSGQFNHVSKIFWASGTAMFARRSALEKVGIFDTDFFAHMEEIDVCWRLQLAGYKILAEPKSEVYHYGGATLAAGSPQKVYLNHRNNVMMLLKNLSTVNLFFIVPVRLLLEVLSIAFYLKKSGFEYAGCVVRGLVWNLKMLFRNLRKRSAIQSFRIKSDSEIFQNLPFAKVLLSVAFRPSQST
ncbi:MAG: glycosyltransferase family 2 protein [Chloroherpetonaceae bacterium]|nr:glycosyltransferase family 2 protein [Chloroherpetonaceae bacterium]